ncbi:hypothetical protein LSCM1_04488 [Leishmania martiniquensis]|uniref:SAM-dependent methyltransferase RsmB-F/NOP2-type catalytic core domain-containing protein n=1 Tax=Leishmania martiniquensis TaxID=1580590 RepID=A0A836KF25_9TRYP|nr:hypothetical protein LSCM1_04488 [Leishmania martiniquensis]
MTAGVDDAVRCHYPCTFSAELIRHCEDGCIPPEVFADARALLVDEQRRRYVRINPRCEERVLRAGAEALPYQRTPSQAVLIKTETFLPLAKEVANAPPTAQCAGATTTVSLPADDVIPSSGANGFASGNAARADVLRLGLATLTGLPLTSVEPVAWLPRSVFSLPWSYAMGGNPLFLDGTLLAMDATSIAAVVSLHPRKGDRILDLCCAPGMKLGLLADAVSRGPTSGSESPICATPPLSTDGLVVGVDVSLSRLYRTRSTLKKQQQRPTLQECVSTRHDSPLPVCLFADDGCRFSMERAAAALDLTGSAVDAETGLTTAEKRQLQRRNYAAAATSGLKRGRVGLRAAGSAVCDEMKSIPPPSVVYASARTRAIVSEWLQEKACGSAVAQSSTTPLPSSQPLLFDRVLVDAECSHDGSVAHMLLGEQHTRAAHGGRDSAPDARAASPAASTIQKGIGVHNEYRMRHMNLGVEAGVTESPREEARSASEQPMTSLHTGSRDGGKGDASSSPSASLFALQSRLLDNGYRQLQPGGTLVYATCSYSWLQNEFVVGRFLERANAAPEVVDRSNARCSSTGNDIMGRPTAVLVPAFSYAHEAEETSRGRVTDDNSVAACVKMDNEAQRCDLQRMLDTHVFDYGTVQRGRDRYACTDGANYGATEVDGNVALGSRFWPRTFQSSFLYVAKIWKRPPESAVSVEGRVDFSKE